MKRHNHLFEKIISEDNFWLAYKNAVRGKSKKKDVINFQKNLEENMRKLRQEVVDGTYKISSYYHFQLWSGHKWRDIFKLPIRDRIVQHAIMNILKPIFIKMFIKDTYASIEGRGIHRGLKRVRGALKDIENTTYCLKLDIHKFYPSIDQEILKRKLLRKFKDKKLLSLLFTIIDSHEQGVPIGNYTSQYFANFFLNDFDHYLKEQLKVKYYFRYCDDLVILGGSKDYLRSLLEKINAYLAQDNLKVKANYQIFPVESRGVNFLGYVSYHGYTRVRKHIKISFIKKKDISTSVASYKGMLMHADCRNLWNKYIILK